MRQLQDRADYESDENRYARLNAGLEQLIDYASGTLRPQLERAGMTEIAGKLQRQLEYFDQHCQIPYVADTLEPPELKARYDRCATTVARICGLLYHTVHEQCSFAQHYEMLNGMMDAMHGFNRHTPAALKQLKLEYHEFDSLTLELEAKLGFNGSPPGENHAEKTERRRRMPKNPQRIEAALRECLDTASQLRPLITNEQKQHKLDRIVGDVRSILSNLPQGDDDISSGRRISALVSGSAKILKVGKWIRQVDLLGTQQSESVKREILRQFDDLTALSRGQEPGAAR